MNAREEMLLRIRRALVDSPAPAPVVRDYRGPGAAGLPTAELLERFAERVADYRADVHRTGPGEVRELLAELLAGASVVLPEGFPSDFAPAAELLREPLSVAALDRAGAVLTTCAVAVAETGTIVLDHSAGQGRRALTLVPDRHVVVVRSEQVVATVPDAIAALDPSQPLTFVSGPSATSDIELNRVEGVHGPRKLDVVLVDAGRG